MNAIQCIVTPIRCHTFHFSADELIGDQTFVLTRDRLQWEVTQLMPLSLPIVRCFAGLELSLGQTYRNNDLNAKVIPI